MTLGDALRRRLAAYVAAHPPRVREMQVQMGAFSMTKRGAARFDWRDPYHFAVGLRWRWFLLLVLGVYTVLNLAFGVLYALRPGSVANLPAGSYLNAVFFSIETLATVGYGVMAPQTLYGHMVSSIEIVVGMAFTAIVTGLLFVRIARPRPRLLYARNMVVARHNGRACLMLRLANGRAANLTHAVAEVTVLLPEVTAEGQNFRRSYVLRLERDRLPIFALSWTLIHVIDETSPLAGYDAARLAAENARFFLSVEARDPVLAAGVIDMHDYVGGDVLYGMRFADVVTTDDAGRIVADLTRLHDVEPDAVEAAADESQGVG